MDLLVGLDKLSINFGYKVSYNIAEDAPKLSDKPTHKGPNLMKQPLDIASPKPRKPFLPRLPQLHILKLLNQIPLQLIKFHLLMLQEVLDCQQVLFVLLQVLVDLVHCVLLLGHLGLDLGLGLGLGHYSCFFY